MATVNVIHYTRYKSKEDNGLFPVVFLIRSNGTNSHIQTGLKVDTKHFDKFKWIKKNTPGVINHVKTNSDLQKKLSDIQDFISLLTISGEVKNLTASQIKKRYIEKKAKEKLTFTSYFAQARDQKKKQNTVEIYNNTLILLDDFRPGPINFSEVNYQFLKDFEKYMISKRKITSLNTVSIHMRNIRAVFNQAINEDIVNLGLYPFRKYNIPSQKTEKRNLSEKDLRALNNVELSGVPGLARDVFFLSFYLIGINLKDLTYLKKSNIRNGRLNYVRMKTGKKYSIRLEPEAIALIKKLKGKNYLINLLDRYQNYDSVRKEIDKKLKVAAKKAKLDVPLSTYYARHSWATIASKIGISHDTISASLGHEMGSRTTAIYIEYDTDLIDKASRKVLNRIIGT
jgi:integrase